MNTAPQRNTYADLLALPEHVIGELIGGLEWTHVRHQWSRMRYHAPCMRPDPCPSSRNI